MKNIAIIITSHNRLFKTRRCLLSILKLKNKYNIKINIYLTNDGCTDGTKEYIKKNYPKLKFLTGVAICIGLVECDLHGVKLEKNMITICG